MKYQYTYETPIGRLIICEEDNYITHVLHETIEDKKNINTYYIEETPTILLAKQQLDEYFSGHRKEFELPIAPKGTEFQKKVWEELRRIPYGSTMTYQEVAIGIGNPKGQRAVGMANNKNPILIITPCHRVIGKNGSLVGFAAGLDAKKHLLELEIGK